MDVFNCAGAFSAAEAVAERACLRPIDVVGARNDYQRMRGDYMRAYWACVLVFLLRNGLGAEIYGRAT